MAPRPHPQPQWPRLRPSLALQEFPAPHLSRPNSDQCQRDPRESSLRHVSDGSERTLTLFTAQLCSTPAMLPEQVPATSQRNTANEESRIARTRTPREALCSALAITAGFKHTAFSSALATVMSMRFRLRTTALSRHSWANGVKLRPFLSGAPAASWFGKFSLPKHNIVIVSRANPFFLS